jgi:hypothetical protein
MNEKFKEVPIMMLGGSPTIVALPPIFAEHISAIKNGIGGILRIKHTSTVKEAMNIITMMLSMKAARKPANTQKKINT